MAQTGYTPISIYYSATTTNVPTAGNLVAGELAINTADGKLFYKDSSGVVQTLATKGSAVIGGATTQVQYNLAGALAGSSSFVFDGTNVGIGNSSPAYKLDVVGTTKSSALQTSGTATGAFVANSWFVQNEGAANGNYVYYTGNDASTFGVLKEYSATSTGSPYVTRIANNIAHVFYTNATEALRIDASQNIGVGVTPSPWNLGKAIEINNAGNAVWGALPANLNLFSNVYYNSGYKYALSSHNACAYQLYEGLHNWYIAGSGTAGSTVTAFNTVAMTLTNSGAFIVGNTVPPLGAARSYGNYWYADGGYNSRTTANHRDWGIDATNGVVINFYSDNGSAAVYAGAINVNGNTTAYTSISDYRLKENVASMVGALDKVNLLKPVTYTFKDGGQKSQGFIAHELQAIIPECVTGEKDATRIQKYEITPAIPAQLDETGKVIKPAIPAVMGEREVPDYQGVDTSFLIATLTAAIQELNAKVTALEAKVG